MTNETKPPYIAANLTSIHAFAGLYTLRSALRRSASRAAAFFAASMRRAASAADASLGFFFFRPLSTPKSAAIVAFHSDLGTTTGAPPSPLPAAPPTSESFSVLSLEDPLETGERTRDGGDGWMVRRSGESGVSRRGESVFVFGAMGRETRGGDGSLGARLAPFVRPLGPGPRPSSSS